MSARRRENRRDAKGHFEREVRAIERERRRLECQRREAAVVPLDQPYQRGWVRYFDWSEGARRHTHFEEFSGMLEVMQDRQWSRHPDFRIPRWMRRLKPRRWGPYLARSPREWLRLMRDPSWAKYLLVSAYQPVRGVEHLRELARSGWGGRVGFKHPLWLVPCLEPHMITHCRVALPEVDSRLAEIDDWIEGHGGWNRIHRVLGCRNWKWVEERDLKLRRVDIKETREELERHGFVRAFRLYGLRQKPDGWVEFVKRRSDGGRIVGFGS